MYKVFKNLGQEQVWNEMEEEGMKCKNLTDKILFYIKADLCIYS